MLMKKRSFLHSRRGETWLQTDTWSRTGLCLSSFVCAPVARMLHLPVAILRRSPCVARRAFPGSAQTASPLTIATFSVQRKTVSGGPPTVRSHHRFGDSPWWTPTKTRRKPNSISCSPNGNIMEMMRDQECASQADGGKIRKEWSCLSL